jgi:hypothetical protein
MKGPSEVGEDRGRAGAFIARNRGLPPNSDLSTTKAFLVPLGPLAAPLVCLHVRPSVNGVVELAARRRRHLTAWENDRRRTTAIAKRRHSI